MSNETDLDWLARNVHVWPAGDHQPWCYVYWKGGYRAVSGNCITVIQPCVRVEMSQWLARRSELQNKPSFADHPDAKCFVQIAGGGWYKNKSDVELVRSGSGATLTSLGVFELICSGEVLGDWRDTLEKRPVDLSESAVTERLQEATDDVLAAVPELKSDKYKFDQIISIEDNQELSMTKQQEVKQGNRWFERGELPPVGVECEAKKYGKEEWYKVVICGAGKHLGLAVAFYEKQKGSGAFTCSSAEYFRPIRTEREVAIEHMQSDIAERWANCEELAKYLVDKGWVKASK